MENVSGYGAELLNHQRKDPTLTCWLAGVSLATTPVLSPVSRLELPSSSFRSGSTWQSEQLHSSLDVTKNEELPPPWPAHYPSAHSPAPWHILQSGQVAVQVEAEFALVAHDQVAWLLADAADSGTVIQGTWATSRGGSALWSHHLQA